MWRGKAPCVLERKGHSGRVIRGAHVSIKSCQRRPEKEGYRVRCIATAYSRDRGEGNWSRILVHSLHSLHSLHMVGGLGAWIS